MKRILITIVMLVLLTLTICSCGSDRIKMRDDDVIGVVDNYPDPTIYESWEPELASLIKSINDFDGEELFVDEEQIPTENIRDRISIYIERKDHSKTVLIMIILDDGKTGALRIIEIAPDSSKRDTHKFAFEDEELYEVCSAFMENNIA